jgi:DNA-binding beta-propeller fold protein YncE
MHPDNLKLAAYLDSAIDDDERADLRAHILTCAACTARLERLRDDARRIAVAVSNSTAAPDVRAAVRARLRPPASRAWLESGLAVAGALAALLLFAVLIGLRGGGTASRVPDRLFLTDRNNSQLVVLDAGSGARMGRLKLTEVPNSIVYDDSRDRLYVLLGKSVLAVDPQTLQPVGRWQAPQPFGIYTSIGLDSRRGRLYVAQPQGITALDTAELTQAQTYDIGRAPTALAVAPDGSTLFALDPQQARLWTIDVASGSSRSQVLAPSRTRNGFLKVSGDGQYVYVLLTNMGERGDQPALWRLDRAGQAAAPTLLAQAPPPYDMELLDTGQLAIPRGDTRVGGVELVSTDTMSTVARLEPGYDQHHVVVGPNGALYGLNFTHNTITRFDASARTVVWRTPEDRDLVPWDGVFVRGGWRWPF